MENKWELNHGIHRGTFSSRDAAETEFFDTKDEALQKFTEHKKFYRSIGYVIWFANLVSPDGIETQLESNSNYR